MIEIITYDEKTVQALHDALLYDGIIGNAVILSGMEMTELGGANFTLDITAGYGVIQGRVFKFDGGSVDIAPPTSGTTNGQIIIQIDLSNDDAYYQYALSIAHQVVNGEISSEKGFEILTSAAIDTGYHDAFMNFYYIKDDADLIRDGYSAFFCDGSMRKDNIEEWMFQYFEKLIKINE